MDFALALRTLTDHKRWLVPAALVAVLVGLVCAFQVKLFPPSIESKSIEFGAASSDLLVDSAQSSLGDLAIPVEALSQRAAVYAELMKTEAVSRRIASRADLPQGSVIIDGSTSNIASVANEPTGAERAAELFDEGAGRLIFFRTDPTQPIIRISTQAPTAEEAVALADSAGRALSSYVEELQVRQGVPPTRRVTFIELGRPSGGLVNDGADLQLAAMAAVGVFGLGCALIIFGFRVRDALDRATYLEMETMADRSSNGWSETGARGVGPRVPQGAPDEAFRDSA